MDTAVPAGTPGFTANTLKWIAIAAMLIDHIADGFLEYGTWPYILMRLVGRITGPTMFYMVAVGYRHTRSKNRYTLRLLLFAAVSYVPYLYFHTGGLPNGENWLMLNVGYTILLGLLAIRVRHEIPSLALRILLLCLLLALSSVGDWGVAGFLAMVAFDFFYGDKPAQFFAYFLIMGTEAGLFMLLTYPLQMRQYTGEWSLQIYPDTLFRLGMLLPALLLWRYNGQKGGGGAVAKWVFYAIYPLHFLLYGFVRYVLLPG